MFLFGVIFLLYFFNYLTKPVFHFYCFFFCTATTCTETWNPLRATFWSRESHTCSLVPYFNPLFIIKVMRWALGGTLTAMFKQGPCWSWHLSPAIGGREQSHRTNRLASVPQPERRRGAGALGCLVVRNCQAEFHDDR